MTKGVLSGLRLAASKRAKRLQAAAEKTADELLEKSYVGTAEQTLRGAATMTKILHEEDGDIAKAKSMIAGKPSVKKVVKKKTKRNISKRSAQSAVKRKSGKR